MGIFHTVANKAFACILPIPANPIFYAEASHNCCRHKSNHIFTAYKYTHIKHMR